MLTKKIIYSRNIRVWNTNFCLHIKWNKCFTPLVQDEFILWSVAAYRYVPCINTHNWTYIRDTSNTWEPHMYKADIYINIHMYGIKYWVCICLSHTHTCMYVVKVHHVTCLYFVHQNMTKHYSMQNSETKGTILSVAT